MFVAKHHTNRDHHIPVFLLAYTSAVHKTTGRTSAALALGESLDFPLICCTIDLHKSFQAVPEYASRLLKQLHLVRKALRKKMKLENDRYRPYTTLAPTQ